MSAEESNRNRVQILEACGDKIRWDRRNHNIKIARKNNLEGVATAKAPFRHHFVSFLVLYGPSIAFSGPVFMMGTPGSLITTGLLEKMKILDAVSRIANLRIQQKFSRVPEQKPKL